MNRHIIKKELTRLWARAAPLDIHTFIVMIQVLIEACSLKSKHDLEMLSFLRGLLENIKAYKEMIDDQDRIAVLHKIDSTEAYLQKLYARAGKIPISKEIKAPVMQPKKEKKN